MPKVGSKSYPYTVAGKKKAKEAIRKKSSSMRKQGKSRR